MSPALEPTRGAPPRVVFFSLAATSCLALSFYAGGVARMAAIPKLPAPATPTSTLLVRLSAIAVVLAGLSVAGDRRTRLRVPYQLAVVALALIVVASEKLLWNGVPLSAFKAIATSTVVLLVAPRAWKLMNDRQIAIVLAPLGALCVVSAATQVLQHRYLFPWYDRWGLVAAILAGVAAVGRELSPSVRIGLGGVAAVSVVLSTSRQGVVALLLVAAALLVRSRGIAPKARALALGAVGSAAVYATISAAPRLQALGGIHASNGRYALWSSAWSVLSRSPVFGLAGSKPTEDFTMALRYVALGWSDSVHDFVLDSWLRGGAAAAIAAVVFAGSVVWSSDSRGRTIGLTLVPFFLFGSQLLYFGDPSAAILIAIAYGIGLGSASRAPLPAQQPEPALSPSADPWSVPRHATGWT
jgi:O-antigen ligase/polysaccharide polymerase Wzy-like membrane protein